MVEKQFIMVFLEELKLDKFYTMKTIFKFYLNRSLILIGILISMFIILNKKNTFAGPRVSCKAHKTNVCYIGPMGYEYKGILYFENR